MKKALVIETAFLGDAVISTALAVELKRLEPERFIAYLVRPDTAELLRCCTYVDEVLVFDKHGADSGRAGLQAMASRLNNIGFDSVYAVHGSKRTEMLVNAVKAPIKVSYSTSAVFTHHARESGRGYRSERVLGLLKQTHPKVNLEAFPSISPPQHTGGKLSRVIIAPGSVWATKEWTPEGFAEVATHLIGGGYHVALCGSPKDRALCTLISEMISLPESENLAGKISLTEFASLIAASDLVIANDSAPIHIALAVRTPSVAIFGPTVSAMGFAPPSDWNSVVEVEGLWCRPCSPHGSIECPKHDHECMRAIHPDLVLDAARKQFKFAGQQETIRYPIASLEQSED